MTTNDLEFISTGCCGEHRAAVCAMADGSEITVRDHNDGFYTVIVMRDGVLSRLVQSADTEEVNVLLAG